MVEDIMVHVNDVTKVFNEYNKIENIQFQIRKGECFALCGGNGAGKSTVIQMLIGNLKPSSGELLINNRKASTKDLTYKSLFSYMPDTVVFPKTLTGYEVLTFFAKLQGITKERVQLLLKKVGLEKDKDKKVKDYSKGMQQRLALAQSLLPEAPLLILDEPTNGLDPYWVYEFKKMMEEEKQKGTTILFSSHILADVEELADKVAFMKDGKLLVVDEIEQLTMQEGKQRSLEEVFFTLAKNNE